MEIIAHRGFWTSEGEKNSEIGFSRALDAGYGIETDVRDCCGKLVISHDMPDGLEMEFSHFLKLTCIERDRPIGPIALNIKADGMAPKLKELLKKNTKSLRYFVFDMSVPDTRSYIDLGFPVFTRLSEEEVSPSWLEQCCGIWVDAFRSDWFEVDAIVHFIEGSKQVCIVSSELHGRNHEALWRKLLLIDHRHLMLCTDYPAQAEIFFNSKSDN